MFYCTGPKVLIYLIPCFHVYHPPTKLREGNVFSRVCLSFCPQGVGPMWPLPMMQWTSLYSPNCSSPTLCTWDLTGQGPSHTVQTCSLQDPPQPHLCWHLVAIEAHTVGASGRYAFYWNAFSCALVTRGRSRMLRKDDPRDGKRQHTISPSCLRGCLPGRCLPGGCLPRECLLGDIHPAPQDQEAETPRTQRQTPPDPEADTPAHTLWTGFLTHYLSATTVADGKNPQLRGRGGGGEGSREKTSRSNNDQPRLGRVRFFKVVHTNHSECEIKVASGAVLVCFPRGASNDLMGQIGIKADPQRLKTEAKAKISFHVYHFFFVLSHFHLRFRSVWMKPYSL